VTSTWLKGTAFLNTLVGLHVAILVSHGFAPVELIEPRKALEQAGARTYVISPVGKKVRARYYDSRRIRKFKVNVDLCEADADDYDILLVPGGVRHPAQLGRVPGVLKFAHAFFEAGKPVAKIFYSTHWWWITVWNTATGAMTYPLATGHARLQRADCGWQASLDY
jgi:protease I